MKGGGIINSPKEWGPVKPKEPEKEEYRAYGYTFKPYVAPTEEQKAKKADDERRNKSIERAYKKVEGTPA